MHLTYSLFLFVVGGARSQPPPPPNLSCSGADVRFPSPGRSQCFTSWGQRLVEKKYPEDFDVLNSVNIYKCPLLNKRIIISNGIPDHDVIPQSTRQPCEYNWVVEMPLKPELAREKTEVPIRGMIAMALNGVPAFGPQENDSKNAVEPGDDAIQGAQFWYGHSSENSAWHVHNPHMGKEAFTEDELLGYAMDGFPIYGPLKDGDIGQLDACNGRLNKQGNYQYHVRKLDQVDNSTEYCNGDSPEVNWNYILGCYSGTVAKSAVFDSNSYYLDTEYCFDEEAPPPTPAPSTRSPSYKDNRPNIIIMQPDDLPFFDEWGAPPNIPNRPRRDNNVPAAGMPNIERLRLNGLQMMQAYTTSPMCGTSRYSTITGKYASRSSFNRATASNTSQIANVIIPTTKLADMNGHHDCTSDNLAATFRNNGYHTAMIGKWHLSQIPDQTYTYDSAVSIVEGCGFSTVGGLYIENLNSFSGNYADGTFSHNMEWITWEAIKVINKQANASPRQPFFMYFNPTVPHSANSIAYALRNFTCQDTANGTLGFDPSIPGMTGNGSCEEYRQSIYDRTENEDDYGPLWLDDSVGALLKALEDNGMINNTIFLFQEDHGMDTKGSLYEQGVRIPQFIHYPDEYLPGTKFDAPVSVIDIGATMFDFADITPNYDFDGISWKNFIGDRDLEQRWKNQRCLFFENERDRGARCGCDKYLEIKRSSSTYEKGLRRGFSTDPVNLFDLCGGTGDYITEKTTNMESAGLNLNLTDVDKTIALSDNLRCHLNNTDLSKDLEYIQCKIHSGSAPSVSPAPSKPETTYPSQVPSISPEPSPSVGETTPPSAFCPETRTDEFFYRMKPRIPNEPIIRTCGFLRNSGEIENICQNYKDSYNDGNGVIFRPAQEVCKQTCNTCYLLHPSQSPSQMTSVSPEPSPSVVETTPPSTFCPETRTDEFFYRMKPRIPNEPIIRTCGFLRNSGEIENICQNYKDSYNDGNGVVFRPAREVCKQTCNTCYLLHPSQSPSQITSEDPSSSCQHKKFASKHVIRAISLILVNLLLR